MANLTCLTFQRVETIPPDGQSYFAVKLDNFPNGAAVTVTAWPMMKDDTRDHSRTLYMEVIQTATRMVFLQETYEWWLDIVVRNNSHANTPQALDIDAYNVYVSYVTP